MAHGHSSPTEPGAIPNSTIPWAELSEFREFQANVDVMFLLFCGFMVFFMKAGFAFLEAGAVRRKSVVNTLFRNFMDLYVCATAYWLFGYAFAFGSAGNPFIGYDYRYFALAGLPPTSYAMWFFQMVFGEAAGTIMSGAVAERANSLGYIIANFLVTGFVYPIVTHWVWSPDGWLFNGDGNIGFIDFAGSGCVHVVGGSCALVATLFVGPRIGRFDHNGAGQELKGHNLPFTALGALILFFGFFAFNAGSQKSISQPGDGAVVGKAVVNTIIAACSGGGALTFFIKIREKRWTLLQGLNGALAGMVAICAGCATMHPWAGCCTGIVAGLVYYFYSKVTPRLRIDDPVDAIALHLGGGSWGIIAYALLSENGVLINWTRDSFLVLAWQICGLVSISAWSMGTCATIFGVLKICRLEVVSGENQFVGQDLGIHKEPGYGDDEPLYDSAKPSLVGTDVDSVHSEISSDSSSLLVV